MTRWLKGEVQYPPRRAYEELVERFGDEVPAIVTNEERSRSLALENAGELNKASRRVRSTRARAGGRAGKGRRKPEHSERIRDWHASAVGQEHRRELQERQSGKLMSPEDRSLVSLGKWLRNNPGTSKEQVVAFAAIVADRLGVPTEQVMEWWRERLRKEGFPVGPGRHPQSEDKQFIDREMAKVKRTSSGQLPQGFWLEVTVKLGRQPDEWGNVKRMWYRAEARNRA